MTAPTEPRFRPGQPVRVADREAIGHCRTPFFLRGHRGIVDEIVGHYRNPEQLAYHKPGLPRKFLYRIRFDQKALWPDYAQPDEVVADIFEHWLDPVE